MSGSHIFIITIGEKMMARKFPDINVSFPGGKKVDAQFNDFTIQTDQPIADGGGGTAPAPYILFLSSLATCAGIYVLGFCQAREIDTTGISITQSHEFVADGPKAKRLGKVGIQINVPPSFPQKHYATLVRVAEQCAVKKVLENPPEFVVETVVT